MGAVLRTDSSCARGEAIGEGVWRSLAGAHERIVHGYVGRKRLYCFARLRSIPV